MSTISAGASVEYDVTKARAFVTSFSLDAPPEVVDIRDPVDTLPSDKQPPGVDDDEPQSLEEDLMG